MGLIQTAQLIICYRLLTMVVLGRTCLYQTKAGERRDQEEKEEGVVSYVLRHCLLSLNHHVKLYTWNLNFSGVYVCI